MTLASFPGLPRFRSSVCVQYNTRTQTEELKRGMPGNEAMMTLFLLHNENDIIILLYDMVA